MIDAEAVASVPVASAFPKYAVGNKRRKNKKETEDEMRRQTVSPGYKFAAGWRRADLFVPASSPAFTCVVG